MNPLPFLLVCCAGWMNRHQQVVIEYLQAEIGVLKEQLGRRPRFNDDQRRRLAVKGKPVGRKDLLRLASIVTPDTLLGWHRRLIAKKYDTSQKRKPGRPLTAVGLRELILRMARDNALGVTHAFKAPCRTWVTKSAVARLPECCRR